MLEEQGRRRRWDPTLSICSSVSYHSLPGIKHKLPVREHARVINHLSFFVLSNASLC